MPLTGDDPDVALLRRNLSALLQALRTLPVSLVQVRYEGARGRCRLCEVSLLAEAGIEPSVGSKGDSYDNALAETINGLYKTELIHRQPWKSREAVEMATLKWVHWYNTKRLMEPLGDIPPAEAEANFYRQQASQAMAA